jgi:hypothetical protein
MSRGAVDVTFRGAVDVTLIRFSLPRIQRYRHTPKPNPWEGCPSRKSGGKCPPGGRPPPERRPELPLRNRSRADGKERRSSRWEELEAGLSSDFQIRQVGCR